MPSSYTSSLRLTLPATGELGGQWGSTVNTGITELLDAAVAGTASISTWGGAGVAYTLSSTNGAADEARKMFIVASGSPGEAKNVICPAVSKFYVFRNDTTGGFALTLKTGSGTGISVPAGQYRFLYCDGTNVVEAFNSAAAIALSGNLTLSGGTANGVLYLNGSKVVTTGSGLTFDGTNFATTGTASATKFIPTGGTATGNGMYLPAANEVAWSVNGSEGMRLNTTGLGIGITSPVARLDVAGNIHLRDGDTIYSGGQLYVRSGTGKTLDFGANNINSLMILDTSGNLGLGVTPSAWGSNWNALQLGISAALWAFKPSAGLSGTYLSNNNYFNGTSRIYTNTAAATEYAQITGQHIWYTAPSGTAGNAITWTQAMTLDASGNLGVGETAPSAKLDLKSGSVYLRLDPASESTILTNGATALTLNASDASSSIRFRVAGNERARITSGGDLLVNTTTVVGRITADGAIAISTTAGNDFITKTGTYTARFGINTFGLTGPVLGTETNHALLFATNQIERARITSGGDLLVGKTASDTATAGAELRSNGLVAGTVSGSHAYYANRNTSDGNIFVFERGSVTVGTISVTGSATAYNTSSDYRLKDNPQPLTNSGAFIDALQPKTWEWKTDGSRGVGFIAHEAQAVSPSSVVGEKDAVDADGNPVMQAMEYGSAEFIANIIAELQSLRARVAALEAA